MQALNVYNLVDSMDDRAERRVVGGGYVAVDWRALEEGSSGV